MNSKLGVLMIGLNGAVSTTTIAAAMAISKGLCPNYGLYTETPMSAVKEGKLDRRDQKPIKEVLGLVDFKDLVFGGWDIEDENVYDCAKKLKIVPPEIVETLSEELKEIRPQQSIFSSEYLKALEGKFVTGGNLLEKADKIRRDIRHFKKQHGRDAIVVINVASTEVYHTPTDAHKSLDAFEKGLKENNPDIGPAQVYAYAAMSEGAPYINFTPSLAEETPALRELADKTKTPVAGKDGKTGQTLMKTAIAQIFGLKNLYVDGWFSTNILGNKDGLVLDEPGSLKSKIVTKSNVLSQILGYDPFHKVYINYYPPRGDDKEAWDNIDFRGVLGQPMQLKLNFLCKDSILAAGSILDLIRLIHYAKQQDEYGVQEQFSFFFKSPDTKEPRKQPIHGFFKQEGMLKEWMREKAYGVRYKTE